MPAVTIPERFNGPNRSGNGGYAAGLLADLIEGPAEVRLHVPPPLGRQMVTERSADGWLMFDGETLVAEATPTSMDIEVPEPVSFEAAEAATAGFPGWDFHGAPRCFVCGPERHDSAGLRIFPGPVGDGRPVAAPWVVDEAIVGADGKVPDLVLWGVLDCPGAWAGAVADRDGWPYFPALGTMAGGLESPVRAGERLVVMSWHVASEGRKLFTEAALYGEDGTVKGRARHIVFKVPGDRAAPAVNLRS